MNKIGLNIKPDRCKFGRILQRIGYQEVDNGYAYEPIARFVYPLLRFVFNRLALQRVFHE